MFGKEIQTISFSFFVDSLDEAEFIPSSKGGAQLVDKSGYIYNKKGINIDGQIIFWDCRRKRYKCRAMIHSKGPFIIKYINEHQMDCRKINI